MLGGYYHSNNLLDFAIYGDKYMSLKVKKDLEMKDFNVSVGAAITSYARMKLWSLMHDIEEKGFKVYYCDTDSVITNCCLADHEDLMKEYCWDGTGDALGSLKNEALAKIVKYNKSNPDNKIDIERQKELDGGDICFDKAILCGCKFYAISKTCYNGVKIEICKCKGYRSNQDKLRFNDFEKLADGRIDMITQNQVQFSIPKSAMLDEVRKFGVIVNNDVHKKFKPTYTKGIILDDGTVNPFIR